MWAGTPAKLLRKLSTEEMEFFGKAAENYVKLAATHRDENRKTYQEIEADKVIRKNFFIYKPPIGDFVSCQVPLFNHNNQIRG